MHHLRFSRPPSSPARTSTTDSGLFIQHHPVSPLPLEARSCGKVASKDALGVLINGGLPIVEALQADDLAWIGGGPVD
jgi:hypothetical protein